MKLTKCRLNKILQLNRNQTRKKTINNKKLLTHNISQRRKSHFNLRTNTLRHYTTK